MKLHLCVYGLFLYVHFFSTHSFPNHYHRVYHRRRHYVFVKPNTKIGLYSSIPSQSIFKYEKIQSSLALNNNNPLIISADVSEFRQYAPLVVSLIVILDILLGSPLVNLILVPMRRQAFDESSDDIVKDDDFKRNKSFQSTASTPMEKVGERIDCDQFAQEVIEKARSQQELINYMQSRKSNSDRIMEVKRKFDNQLERFDNEN